MITNEDLQLLRSQTVQELARWHCLLNSWEWPEGLPNPESSTQWQKGRRRSIAEAIQNILTGREISRAWWAFASIGTEAEWETWWNSKGRHPHYSVLERTRPKD